MNNPTLTMESAENFLLTKIKPRFKSNPQLQKVIVWVKAVNASTGLVTLGLALGDGTGCSPFCGCAANQISELIEEKMLKCFPGLARVRGEADIPKPEVMDKWNKA